ncbi:MAG TPA: cyclodeaminase/cyclohydrolase family protein [Candidatus Omnitrophota bacterium]|nr:cyclodeaminase/cyclohydrolase family protein [Candidatus Omnitrophota bacterium]
MKYINSSIKKYIKDVGARTPAPGGGSVAALSAALSASLIKMACNFTLGKEKYKKSESRIKVVIKKLDHLLSRAELLVDEDVKAYGSGDMEKWISVPLEVAFISFELFKLSVEVLKIGNKRLFSDVKLAGAMAESAFKASCAYVEINLASLDAIPEKISGPVARLKNILKKQRFI